MKSVDATDAKARMDELLEEVQQQPIVIRRGDRDVAAVVSMAFYERLRAIDVEGFLALRSKVAQEAASAGLTPERLTDLVRDEQ